MERPRKLLFRVRDFLIFPTTMEHQMEENMEIEMETGFTKHGVDTGTT